jgi:hypothetical protein
MSIGCLQLFLPGDHSSGTTRYELLHSGVSFQHWQEETSKLDVPNILDIAQAETCMPNKNGYR